MPTPHRVVGKGLNEITEAKNTKHRWPIVSAYSLTISYNVCCCIHYNKFIIIFTCYYITYYILFIYNCVCHHMSATMQDVADRALHTPRGLLLDDSKNL